jgi:hypothetical protein
VVAVGEAGEPGPDFLSLAGLLPLVVLSPERRNEFCRERPVPANRNKRVNLASLLGHICTKTSF